MQNARRAFRLGIGGPVGSGKTMLVLRLCQWLRADFSIAAITNDIYRHVLQSTRAETMRKLGAAISSNENPTEPAATPGNGVDHRGNAPRQSS